MFEKFFEHMSKFRGGNSNYAFLMKHTDALEDKFRNFYDNSRVVQHMDEWLMIHMSNEGCFARAQHWSRDVAAVPEYMLIDFQNILIISGIHRESKEKLELLQRIGRTLFRHPIVRKTFTNPSFDHGMENGFVIRLGKKGLTQQDIFFSLYTIRSVYELGLYRIGSYPYLRENGFSHVEACHLSVLVQKGGAKLSYGHTPYYFAAVEVNKLIDFIHGSKKFTGSVSDTKPLSCAPNVWAAIFGPSGLSYNSKDPIPSTHSGTGWNRKENVNVSALLQRFQDFKKEKAGA